MAVEDEDRLTEKPSEAFYVNRRSPRSFQMCSVTRAEELHCNLDYPRLGHYMIIL